MGGVVYRGKKGLKIQKREGSAYLERGRSQFMAYTSSPGFSVSTEPDSFHDYPWNDSTVDPKLALAFEEGRVKSRKILCNIHCHPAMDSKDKMFKVGFSVGDIENYFGGETIDSTITGYEKTINMKNVVVVFDTEEDEVFYLSFGYRQGADPQKLQEVVDRNFALKKVDEQARIFEDHSYDVALIKFGYNRKDRKVDFEKAEIMTKSRN